MSGPKGHRPTGQEGEREWKEEHALNSPRMPDTSNTRGVASDGNSHNSQERPMGATRKGAVLLDRAAMLTEEVSEWHPGRRNSLATMGPYADEKATITSHWCRKRRASMVLKIGRRRMWRIITRTPSTAKPPPQRSARVLPVYGRGLARNGQVDVAHRWYVAARAGYCDFVGWYRVGRSFFISRGLLIVGVFDMVLIGDGGIFMRNLMLRASERPRLSQAYLIRRKGFWGRLCYT